MRVLAHRAIEEAHLAAMPLQLLQQQDLKNVIAGQTVRRGDDHQVKAAGGGAVTQAVETRTPQRGATVAVITKDMVEGHVPALLARVALQALNLLLDRLGLRLALRRNPGIERHPHGHPPARRGRATRRQTRRPSPSSRPVPPGRPGPIDAGRPHPAASFDARSTGIASVPPDRRESAGIQLARLDRSRSAKRDQLRRKRNRRTRQNLSFVIRPSRVYYSCRRWYGASRLGPALSGSRADRSRA